MQVAAARVREINFAKTMPRPTDAKLIWELPPLQMLRPPV